MDWKTLLAYITGTVDQELLRRNEYLVTENRILRNQITGRIRLSDGERKTLAEIGQKLGKQALEAVATIVKPDTILGWHRTLVAQKFNGSQQRKAPGRPTIDQELEALVVRMARENRAWGYDRIVGALANLGYTLSDQTVGNILKRHGIAPAPERKTTTTWKEFIRTHMEVLVATDFFTAEVWTGVLAKRGQPTRLSVTITSGSCWIPGSWDLPRSYHPIVVTLSSLKPFFFNGLKKELCFSNNAWSIRPRNPIRASAFLEAT